jgi:hypothetical protein
MTRCYPTLASPQSHDDHPRLRSCELPRVNQPDQHYCRPLWKRAGRWLKPVALHQRDQTAGQLPQCLGRSAISLGQKLDPEVLKFQVPIINSLLFEADRPKTGQQVDHKSVPRLDTRYPRSSGCRGHEAILSQRPGIPFESLYMVLSFYSSREFRGQTYCRCVALAQH